MHKEENLLLKVQVILELPKCAKKFTLRQEIIDLNISSNIFDSF